MLARVSSGASGIVEYLETGKKKEREFERDRIDERLILDGDIDILDEVINSIETTQPGAARYLHITLGLSERFTTSGECGPGEVNRAKLAEVADAYREMLMAGYDRDEYCWYAEAHAPKVTHEIDASTGDMVERLPHIHIVLPMRNMVDGGYLNPTGYGEMTIPYQQAIQEVINERFALKSPLDSKRDQAPEPLARHAAKFDDINSPTRLREELARMVKEGEVNTFDDLAAAAASFGAVKVREGKGGDYLNVAPGWAARGVNLKDFTRQGFADQAAALKDSLTTPPGKPDFQQKANDWTQRVALETRYLTGAGTRKHYKSLDAEGKAEWLAGRASASREQLKTAINEDDKPLTLKKDQSHDKPNLDPGRNAQRAITLYKSNLAKARRKGPPEPFGSVRHLSSLDLVHDSTPAQLLLQPNAPIGMGQKSRSDRTLRREGAGPAGVGGLDSGSEPGVSRSLTFAASLQRSRAQTEPTPDQLKNDSSPTLVLESAVRRFGLDPTEYEISSGRDGTPRIRHNDKHYNLGDLFTKHLNVPWSEAKEILKPCYYQTLADGLPPPDKALWKGFCTWRDGQAAANRATREQSRATTGAQILAARNEYKRTKLNVKPLPRAQREPLMARARAEQIVKIANLQNQARLDREANKPTPRNALYRSFLTDLASKGNLLALGELRRLAKPETPDERAITGKRSSPVFPNPDYRVDPNGRVTYYQSAKPLVADHSKGVAVLDTTDAAYALALKVAVARYGNDLTLNGGPEFIRAMEAAARKTGVTITIRDAAKPQNKPVVVRPEQGQER